jgi:hypothetical protein
LLTLLPARMIAAVRSPRRSTRKILRRGGAVLRGGPPATRLYRWRGSSTLHGVGAFLSLRVFSRLFFTDHVQWGWPILIAASRADRASVAIDARAGCVFFRRNCRIGGDFRAAV